MQSVIKQKTGQNVEVKRTETDSREDFIDGIDLHFTLDGKRYTCQVKPLKEFELINNSETYRIKSSGRIKQYNVSYFVFVNKDRQKFAVFKNRNVTISNDTLTFPKSSFVFSN
jgi:sialic acid synthase SpsE